MNYLILIIIIGVVEWLTKKNLITLILPVLTYIWNLIKNQIHI